jgi:hypothetical protein
MTCFREEDIMKKFLFPCMLLAGLLFLGAVPVAEKPEWIYFGSTPITNDQFYYDGKSVKYQEGESVRVNIKKMVKDPARTIKMRTSQGISVKGYEHLTDIQALWELDCKNSKVATMSETHYDKDGNILDQRTFKKKEWSPITADSLAAQLQGKICRTTGK